MARSFSEWILGLACEQVLFHRLVLYFNTKPGTFFIPSTLVPRIVSIQHPAEKLWVPHLGLITEIWKISSGKELISSFPVPSREVILISRRSRLSPPQIEEKSHLVQNHSFARCPQPSRGWVKPLSFHLSPSSLSKREKSGFSINCDRIRYIRWESWEEEMRQTDLGITDDPGSSQCNCQCLLSYSVSICQIFQ